MIGRVTVGLASVLGVLLLAAPVAGARRRTDPIAPPSVCLGQTDANAPVGVQLKAMLCLTNYARQASGRKPLTVSRPLARAAARKSADILGCDEFSHEACGRDFTYWIERFGYTRGCWRAGENIAFGTGPLGTVREIFVNWMNSPGHRANILGGFREIGIGRRVGTLEGTPGAVVWTQDFGSRAC